MMDPITAKAALDNGAISQDTYNAIVSGVVDSAPVANYAAVPPPAPEVPMGPPAVPMGPPAPLPQAIQSAFGPLAAAPNGLSGHDMNATPQVRIPSAPVVPAVGALPPGISAEGGVSVAAPKQRTAAWSANQGQGGGALPSLPGPKAAPRLNAADTLLGAQKVTRDESNRIASERIDSATREHEAAARGYAQAADEQKSAATDQESQMKQDEGFKIASMQKAQKIDDASRARAQEIADMKIDTGRAWKELGGPGTIMLTLAAALQGYNGDHHALDMMSKNVDRDVAAQMADIQNKKDGWKMEANVAAREAARDQDWLAYRAAKRSEGLNVLKLKVDGITGESKSAQVQEQGKQLALGIQGEIAANNQNYANQTYQNMHGKEAAAAAAAAAQAAAVKEQVKRANELTEKLVVGSEHNKPMDPDAARALANRMVFGVGGPQAAVESREKPGAIKDVGERTVVVDGKEQLATSKEAATNYREFATIQPEAKRLVAAMKTALANSDPAAYESARGKLIEVMPPIYGYKRGPSNTQAEHTFGPEVIPEYPHWYKPTVESTLNNKTRNADGSAIPGNNRVLDKLDDVDKTIDTVGNSLRQQTFGSGPGSQSAPAPAAAKVGDVKFN